MFSTVTCTKCNNVFSTTDAQRLQMQQISNCNGKMAMLKCPVCKKTFSLKLLEQKSVATHNSAIPFLCPAARCGGWVSYVAPEGEAAPFYGCGECGRTWSNMESLQLDITKSIEQYPYRNSAYRHDGNIGWQPLEYKEIASDLYQKIETEDWPSEKSIRKKNQ
jgi:uncharacterized protein YbaR (Trm112 family)